MDFPIEINRFPDPDQTLQEVLTTVAFQNSAGNLLTEYTLARNKVILQFRSG